MYYNGVARMSFSSYTAKHDCSTTWVLNLWSVDHRWSASHCALVREPFRRYLQNYLNVFKIYNNNHYFSYCYFCLF